MWDYKDRCVVYGFFFFFQAEDGIRDAQESRGLGDVYKRQTHYQAEYHRHLMELGYWDARKDLSRVLGQPRGS